jgi:hypothetical protein
MISYRPALASRSLGQLSKLTSGVTSDLAKSIVQEAEPATRRVIRDERNRLAEALIGGIPFAALAAIGYVGTYYLLPDKPVAKFVGYTVSAAALAAGAWWTFSRLNEQVTAPPTPSGAPGLVTGVAAEAAREIVKEAEPKIRQIVQEEKAKAVEAAKAGLPLAIGALAAFLATMFLVKPENAGMKAVGYSGSALLLGAGAWIALDKEMEAMAV